MANALYGKARESFLMADIDWLVDDIRVILVDTADYVIGANIDVHDFLDDVTAAGRVAVSGALAGKTATLGVADATDVTFTAVTGDPCEALVIYKHTGVEGTSNLIAYIDSATGLPVTPNGGNIVVQWDDGASKIFKL
jgi:hypothetical protein